MRSDVTPVTRVVPDALCGNSIAAPDYGRRLNEICTLKKFRSALDRQSTYSCETGLERESRSAQVAQSEAVPDGQRIECVIAVVVSYRGIRAEHVKGPCGDFTTASLKSDPRLY
ncbi:hypothetical protein Tco_1144411 [Tanacetum coccineum]